MYKLLLVLKYTRRKLAPMFAALAVTLCTAMVIIVISVMGGFLDLMSGAAKRVSGDMMVRGPLTGFPYYEELIGELEGLPEIGAATAIVNAPGMIKYGQDQVYLVREAIGIDPAGLDRVTQFTGVLHWTRGHLIEQLGADLDWPDPVAMAQEMDPPPEWKIDKPGLRGVVPGIELYPYNTRDDQGAYHVGNSPLGSTVTLTLPRLTQAGGMLDPVVRELVVVNEFKTGLYDIDAGRVYLPFGLLQEMLNMDRADEVDPETGEPTGGVVPARASAVLIKTADGVELGAAHNAVVRVCRELITAHPDMPPIQALTWRQIHADLLNAVRNEKGLITFLFAFISMVAVVMVATTFSMIVFEKTRDIGVLRAVGASRAGVANIFFGYGLVIGLVGASAGLGLAVAIVYNLNELQDVLDKLFGWRMWNPQTYYFDQIPEQIDRFETALILIGAVVSSVLGALIPAVLAARLDPVKSLRYE